MNDILKTYMERFRENRHTLRRYTAFVLALAMITTLFVNWQLHGVGISMTAQYQCGEEEHTHTADCYTKVLTCGYEEGELENADEVAAAAAATSQPTVEAEPAPLALEPQIEFVPHEHTEDCYTEVQTLTCMEEEHVHGDDCFDPEDGTLICEKFEHTHDENCYTTEYELTCGLEEGELVEQVVEPTQSAELAAMAVAEPVALEPTVDTVEPIYHHHTDACYEEVLTCPLPEHHHTVACLSDTSADVETPEEWQAANAEAVMTGNWDEDLLSVAKTQLGYEQSEKNFEIDPADGVTLRYYSRYGQSYGNPYGEWDVMFLSYCLKYAGIPQSAIPQEASVLSLRSSMSDMDWLLDGEDGSAANVGDIVIYNKYVTRTVAVDSSADGAADDLDDQFSMDAEGENGAELEESGAAALDTAPAAEDAPAADSVITPDLPDTANPEQPAAKPVDSTGTSASGADTLIPSVVSPAAEPQTTTVTDAQPVETVGIVSEADENTLTVISGDVDGKVAEVTISNAEVLAVVDVAAAQYADEKNTSFTSSSDASANINYNNSRLTIVKYSGTQSNVLAGAKFKLQKFGKDNGTWVSVKINGKDEITTNARGNETIGGLDPDTLYCLTETEAPAGYLLPSPNKPYYFAISHESTYTPPVGSGITEIDKLYQLKADQKVGSFYYYCNNTPDETYVLPGKLKVVKKWTDASGNLLTDLRNVPSVTVTLTKSAPATGHTIKVVTAGQTEKEYCTDIRDGAYIYIGSMGNNSELFNQVKASLPSGVTIETTNRADNCYKIGPIKSNFTITSQSLYYNCTNQAGFVEQEEGTEISTEPVVTTVGTVTLNALNKWTYTWDDLETGDGITYSITEETVTGYKTTYTVTVDGTEKTDTSATAIPIDPNKGTLVTITNAEETSGYELPSTGGTGTLPYTAVGGTMMLTALAYSFIHRKRRHEGRADD